MLSNFDFVTESLTLIAVNKSFFSSAIFSSLCTQVVVSSDTPTTEFAILLKKSLFFGMTSLSSLNMDLLSFSCGLMVSGSGSFPVFSYSFSNSTHK